MNTAASKNQSELARIALNLDQEFARFEQLADELERLEIDTENGFDRATKVLGHFSEAGERIGTDIQGLAQALAEARPRAEKAAERVAARAELVRARRDQSDGLHGRFRVLGEMVKKVSGALGELGRLKKSGAMSSDEFRSITGTLPEFETSLGVLIGEARKLESDAKAASFKTLAKDADAMAQSLGAAQRRLGDFAGAQATIQ